MKKLALRSLAVAAVAGMALVAPAQDQFRFDYIGIEAGAYFPTGGTLRDKFGTTVLRLGITPIMNRRTPDWRLSYELGYIGARDDDDRFAIFPATIGMQKSFGDPEENVVPYVRAGAGVAYFDFDIDDRDAKRLGMTTALEAGLIGGDRFKLSLRWYLFPKQEDIDFSGFLISASYGVIKL